MKNIKLLSIAVFAIMCLGFTACTDPDAPSTDKLEGTWKSVWSEGWYKDTEFPADNEEWNRAIPDEDALIITFNKNNTGTQNEGDDFTWKLNGNKLTITESGVDPVTKTMTILKLNNEELVLESHFKEETWENYAKITLKRQ